MLLDQGKMDRQNFFVGWVTRGKLRGWKLMGSLKHVLICVNDLEDLGDITVDVLVLNDRTNWACL